MVQLRKIFKRSELIGFRIQTVSQDILIETLMRCFGGQGSTILDILEDLREARVNRADMINVIIEFEDFIYKDPTLAMLHTFTVIAARYVQYYETVPKEEPQTFTRYIRTKRRAGELIHPEVEKALEAFHCQLEHAAVHRESRLPMRRH
jgi:hypothetical protein